MRFAWMFALSVIPSLREHKELQQPVVVSRDLINVSVRISKKSVLWHAFLNCDTGCDYG